MQTFIVLREDIKYYFADFVRKWGTPTPPHHPFMDKIFNQKSYGYGGGTPQNPQSNILCLPLNHIKFASKKGVRIGTTKQ